MSRSGPGLARWTTSAVACLILVGACSDDAALEGSPAEDDTSSEVSSEASAPTEDTTSGPAGTPTSGGTSSTATRASSSTASSTSLDSSTSRGSSTGDSTAGSSPTVRLGQVAIVRTEPCPEVTVAPTFTLIMTSDAGTEQVPPETATQVVVAEGSPTSVGPEASFTVEGDWSLNVQMLEHLTGTMRGTTHTGPSRLTDEITVDGTPIEIGWTVTQSGNRVELGEPRFAIAPSCVQILPGTLVTFTDGSGSETAGSIDPAFSEPRDLPLNQPVTVFDGANFETDSLSGWELVMTIVEHWNGRNYHSETHTAGDRVTATFPTVGLDDEAWQVRYTISAD